MKNVKYINCFGTSYTAGGGFEFESTRFSRRNFLKNYYKISEEEQTQFNFSWPGRLQKMIKSNFLGSNIEVRNYAKQGYGNELLYRKFYDIFNREDFNKDEHIFLFEISDLGRKEFWSNEFNNYVILNYEVDWDDESLKKCNGLAKNWHYDSMSEFKKLEKMEIDFYNFFSKTFNLRKTVELMERNFLFFVSFLTQNKINYYFTSPANFVDVNLFNDKFMKFGDGIFMKSSNSFLEFCDLNKLQITDETPDDYIDGHCGFVGNDIVGKEVYNFLIDKNEINLEKVNIDYEKMSKLDNISILRKYENKSII